MENISEEREALTGATIEIVGKREALVFTSKRADEIIEIRKKLDTANRAKTRLVSKRSRSKNIIKVFALTSRRRKNKGGAKSKY